MKLLVKIIGEFNDGNSEGLVTDEWRWISQHESFGTCYVSPKTDTIGYNIGLSKLFWTNESIKQWEEPRYVLVRVGYEYQKDGEWINEVGLIEAIWSEDNTILDELLK